MRCQTFLIVFSLFFLAIPLSIQAQDIIITDPTDNKGKVEWQWRVNVGEVPFDKPVTAEFTVKNVSKEFLVIKEVRAGCHCTVADFPKEPIASGDSVVIKATYDARSEGQFFKILTVSTNFDADHLVTLGMTGTVAAKAQ